MMRRLIVMGMLLLTTGLSIMSLSAQDLCESIVQSALALAESNCAGVTGNTACYANNDITPTFYQSVSAPPFWTPGTIVDVSALHVIESTPIDALTNAWGIGYLQTINSELVLPQGSAIRVITMGDVILENASDPAGTGAFLNNLYFNVGGDSDCREAMNIVLLQTPDNTTVTMTINGVEMRISSTIAMGQTTGTVDNPMFVTVLDGQAVLYPETEQEIVVNAGEVSIAVLSPDNDPNSTPMLNAETGLPITDSNGLPVLRHTPITVFTDPLPLTNDRESIWNLNYYETLSRIPEALLNYPVSATLPVPTVTRLYCSYGFNSYNETWDVSNMPSSVTGIVFFGDYENTMQPQNTITILQNRPTQTVYAVTPAGRLDIQVRFQSACPPPPTPSPTDLPTAVIPTQAISATVSSGGVISTPTPAEEVDAFSLTATAIIGELTATAEPTGDPLELTATQIMELLTASAPAPTTHTVETGENAFQIAQRYGVSLDELLEANNIDDPNLLFIGQELVIP